MACMFLSYRRNDSAGFAGRLADDLETAFGAGNVFRDVEDIEPGQDYLGVIDAELDRARVVLVMIGPAWLISDQDGKRRIDQPDDVVRHEIAHALSAGKSVIPVLVSGATMPGETSLPADIAALARREAVVLSDADWHRDVEELIRTLRKWTPPRITTMSRRARILIALGAVALICTGVATAVLVPRQPDQAQMAQRALNRLSGRWNASIRYDWGDQHDEVFEFKPLANALHGTASYLGGRLAIEQATLNGPWLSFQTRSLEAINSSDYKEVIHRYIGQLTPNGIRFTLESSGGYTVHAPVEFIARRDRVIAPMVNAAPTAKE